MVLTKQQQTILAAIRDAEGDPTTHEVGEAIRRGHRDSMHGYYDRAHAALVRLEARGLVERIRLGGNRGSAWRLTDTGRGEIR